MLRAFGNQDAPRLRISLQACAGPGKSAGLAWCGWNFISCYGEKHDHPKGAAVSITRDNLKDNLWAEFSKWQHHSEWLLRAFEWNQERIFAKDHPETWFISARSWPKSASADEQGKTLSGLHSGYVIILVDESGAIPTSVIKAGEQAFSSAKVARMMQAGNPIALDGILYAAATSMKALWSPPHGIIIRITGDPDDPKRSPRIDVDWARQQIALHGRNDPWVRPYILGEFPEASHNQLLSEEDVEAAMRRQVRKPEYDWAQKRLGIDAARFGRDSWVFFPRQGLVAFMPRIERNLRSHEVAQRVMRAKEKWGSEREYFDDTGGYSVGALDALIAAGHSPVPINFAGKAIDPRFYNKRAEMYWNMAEWVKRGGALPDVPDLKKQLTAWTYTFKGGKLILPEKDQVATEKLGGKSPDETDGLVLTFAEPELPAQLAIGNREAAHALTDFDPIEGKRIIPTHRFTSYESGRRMIIEEQEQGNRHALTEFDPYEV